MAQLTFKAPEYQQDGTFIEVAYQFIGDEVAGWEILREGKNFLRLGPGYTPVQSLYCGVCSTDLARHRLPFPLPQITGHEVVGVKDAKPVVVEINASHQARGLHVDPCPYCKSELHIHCPDRLTLGIDRLPGGFASYFLAPVAAIHELPKEITPVVGALIEPFAAALKSVEVTRPINNDRVAVLGPRRLGMLLLAALAGYRKQHQLDFEIIAITRSERLHALCREMGADKIISLHNTERETLQETFDIVYDTTGTPTGFEAALSFARRVVHLKSTSGKSMLGLEHITEMVVEEISLLPCHTTYFTCDAAGKAKLEGCKHIYVTPSVPDFVLDEAKHCHHDAQFHRLEIDQALECINNNPELFADSPLPRFDLAIAANLNEVDEIIRPVKGDNISLVRPGGTILLATQTDNEQGTILTDAICQRGIEVHTSRCGGFERALTLLKDNPHIIKTMEEKIITHIIPAEDIQKAFTLAANSSESIKVVVKTGES